jgi:hypothetical protein
MRKWEIMQWPEKKLYSILSGEEVHISQTTHIRGMAPAHCMMKMKFGDFYETGFLP